MENPKTNIVKNKKMKKALCYFGLFFLVVLLFVPMVFKIVFKEKKAKKVPDTLIRLVCKKNDEKISSTFFNDKPQNILYTIPGSNIENDNLEKEEDIKPENTDDIKENNLVLKKFLNYSSLEFDEEKNIYSINISVGITNGTLDYEVIFNNIDSQEDYFVSEGFSCTRENL